MVMLLVPAALFGQTATVSVAGRVVDEDGRPIAGATVEVPSGFLTAETDADGRFVLRLPPGPTRLLVRRIGYATTHADIVVDAAGTAPVTIRMRADPIALRGISVDAPRMPPLGRTVTT
ncbi:MAG TPA: carboxypeptidase-like regulatory domain-containing protein, partial [Nannocystis sp.]